MTPSVFYIARRIGEGGLPFPLQNKKAGLSLVYPWLREMDLVVGERGAVVLRRSGYVHYWSVYWEDFSGVGSWKKYRSSVSYRIATPYIDPTIYRGKEHRYQENRTFIGQKNEKIYHVKLVTSAVKSVWKLKNNRGKKFKLFPLINRSSHSECQRDVSEKIR